VADLLRPTVAVVVLWLLVRVGRAAWRQRALTVAIWRSVRWRHLAGATGLLVVVATVPAALLTLVPGADLGVGRLLGLAGNAVFAPLEEGMARAGPPPAGGVDWALLVGVSAFLLPLTLLLPWLAFVEEEVFRAGLETAGRRQVALASLAFGLAHLVMLVPVGAALAIGVAGGAYAAVYRRTFARLLRDGPEGHVPAVARRSYRPGRRGSAALAAVPAVVPAGSDPGTLVSARDRHREAQAGAVFAAAVWHTTFNTVLVVLVWGLLVSTAVSPAP
jgi:hypothetical protein